MKPHTPELELLPEPAYGPGNRRHGISAPARMNPKVRVFVVTFLVACILGLAFTFLRPAIYASTATLLVEPPERPARPATQAAIAGASGTITVPAATASVQYLATEYQRLMGEPVLRAVADKMRALMAVPIPPATALAELQKTIAAIYEIETNLIELRVEGVDKEVLPAILRSWIDTYLSSRSATNTATGDTDHEQLQAQLAELKRRIGQQRETLDQFRRTHDIVSQDRTENRHLAKLRGVNEAINVAEGEELKAVAQVEAIRAAIAAGEPVTQGRDRAAIDRLDERVLQLREQVRAYHEQYTEKFIELAPEILAVKDNLAQAEQDLLSKKREATAEVLAEAERTVASTRANKASLEAQQAALKAQVADFSARFQELESMQQELAQLEAQAAALREKLVRAEVATAELYPKVTVLQEPTTPTAPVRPEYLRDAGISMAAAFVLALVAALLYDYLTRVPGRIPPETEMMPNIYSYSTHVFPPQGSPQALPREHAAPALQYQMPRELSQHEVKALFDTADSAGKALIGMLLSGINFIEAASLQWQQLELHADELRAAEPNPRVLRLPRAVGAALTLMAGDHAMPNGSIWRGPEGHPLNGHELSAMLTNIAHDAGIARPGEISPDTLRHTYLTFLVRQGLKLSELQRVAGALSPSVLASYANFSHPGPGRTLEEVESRYPGLVFEGIVA